MCIIKIFKVLLPFCLFSLLLSQVFAKVGDIGDVCASNESIDKIKSILADNFLEKLSASKSKNTCASLKSKQASSLVVDSVSELFFDLNYKKLKHDQIQISIKDSNIKQLKNDNSLTKIRDLLSAFTNLFEIDSNINKDISALYFGKQAYIMRNVNLDEINTKTTIRDPKYRKALYPETTFDFPENLSPKLREKITQQRQQAQNDLPNYADINNQYDFDWIVTQPIPLNKELRAKIKHIHLQPDKDKISDRLASAIFAVVPEIKRPPDKIVAAVQAHNRLKGKNDDTDEFSMSNKRHPQVKGSVSITLYYKIDKTNDVLVITFQALAVELPWGVGYLFSQKYLSTNCNNANNLRDFFKLPATGDTN